jgi:glycosyltransferase involved in cell wall biosynthesis
MHIALVSPTWPLAVATNGIVTYVHVLRSEFIKRGHRVSVFANVVDPTNADSEAHCVKETPVSRIVRRFTHITGKPHDYILSWGRVIADNIKKVHAKYPIDIIEMEESYGWCADVQKRARIPVVVKLHGPAFLSLVEEELGTRAAHVRIDREGTALAEMHAITSPSSDTLARTFARYHLDPAIGSTIPNPMWSEPTTAIWDVDRCDRKTLLFVGRFDKRKGGDIVLLAFQRLLKRFPDLRLVFVGPDVGVISDNGSAEFFDSFCRSLFTAEQRTRITYLGKMHRQDISALRINAMLTIVASRWDNQPNTALEAMIQGCPVVACDNGGVREIITDGVTGLLARSNDIDDLCQKIIRAIADPAEASDIGQRARQFVLERHSGCRVAKATIATYERVISSFQRILRSRSNGVQTLHP